MAFVAACALLPFFIRTRYVWGYLRHVAMGSVSAWGSFLFLAFILVPRLRVRVPRRMTRVLALSSLAMSFYFLWAFFLIMTFWMGETPPADWPRGFPFPDRPLELLAERFDILHPVPPGMVKLHGELPRVLDFVGRLTILSTIVTGFLIALFIPLHPAKNEA